MRQASSSASSTSPEKSSPPQAFETASAALELTLREESARLSELSELLRQRTAESSDRIALATEALRKASEARALLAEHQPKLGSASQVAVEWHSVSMAGTRRLRPDLRSRWKRGDRFSLEPDPSNAHDPNAVRVLFEGEHVGFIAKDDAAELAELLDSGWQLGGQAALEDRRGGVWSEGVLQIRLINPILGWEGYNPTESMAANRAAFERAALEKVIAQAGRPSPLGAKSARL